MTKKIYLFAIGLTIIGAGLTGYQAWHHNSQRSSYEHFIRKTCDHFQVTRPAVTENISRMDQPDMAALDEFLKTVDPATKNVPTERLINAYRQTETLENLKTGGDALTWTAHPTDMGGRTRTLMFDPNDPEHKKMWAGAVTGGLWVNEDPVSGEAWQPVDDFWPDLSISCMTYDPNNTQNFYVGTGESQTALIIYRESSGKGMGIMHSTDGGTSWSLMPSTTGWAYVTSILVRNEQGVSVIYAGVVSGIYKGAGHQSQPGDGLYRSTDGGVTWAQVLPNIPGTDHSYAPSDLDMSSDSSRIFVGTTYGINEDASDNDRSGAACLLYSDDGINWTVNSTYHDLITAGYNIPGKSRTYHYPGRVVLSNVPSNPDMMYALVAGGYLRGDQFIGYDCALILKTEDKGATWTSLDNIPMRGSSNTFAYLAWHALEVEVSPFNPNVIWIGGLDTWRSTDGGVNWTKMSDWAQMYGNGSPKYVHADIHVITYKPGTDNELFVTTDGGIFGTRSAASPTNVVFFELNRNYSTLQYYSCAIHPDSAAIHFMGGLQDNGTIFYKKGDTPTFRNMLSGGDGALCFVDQDHPSVCITTVYNNSIYTWKGDKETMPDRLQSRGFNTGMFINAMDYDWKNDILFANGTNEQGNNKNTLEVIGITESNINGTLRNIPTHSNVPISNVKWSELSPQNLSTLFLGTQAGKLFKLEDAAHIGTLTDLTGADFPTANISAVDIGQSEDTLLVTFSNYGVPSVWLTVDGGQNWKNIEGNLPDMPIRWGIFHPLNGKQVMLATETGAWTSPNVLADPVVWSPDNHGMAHVRIDMLKFRKSDNTVLAATHGRGMFTTIWEPAFVSGTADQWISDKVRVFPNPSNGMISIEIPAGNKSAVSILDVTGRVVLSESIPDNSTTTHRSYNLTHQSKGTYFIRIQRNGKTTTQQLIIQ